MVLNICKETGILKNVKQFNGLFCEVSSKVGNQDKLFVLGEGGKEHEEVGHQAERVGLLRKRLTLT